MALAALSTTFSFMKAMMNMKELISTGQAGDGREKALLDHILKTAEKGNPQSVMKTMDSYAKTSSWFMNIGDDKGPILDKALEKYNPRVVIELGTFCGYSAVRIASQLNKEGSKLLTFEMSPDNCNIARQIIQHAAVRKCTGVGLIYDSQESVKKYESKYRLIRNGLATKVEKSRKKLKERKNRSNKIHGFKKTKEGDATEKKK